MMMFCEDGLCGGEFCEDCRVKAYFTQEKKAKSIYRTRLEKSEEEFARKIAEARHGECANNGMSGPRYRLDSLSAQVLGARGECAASKILNVRWLAGVNTADNLRKRINQIPDLEFGIEVKTVEEDWHRLVVGMRPNPPNPLSPYVLALLDRDGEFYLLGWCWGAFMMQAKYVQDPKGNGPAYYVPQSDLNPISDLMTLIDQWKDDGVEWDKDEGRLR